MATPPVTPKYFTNAFAQASSDVQPVPNIGSSTGSMSYMYGFPINYSRVLGSDPTALPINREQFNQLVQDITSSIIQYQGCGAPDWQETYLYPITQTLGYPLYARVRYTPTANGSTLHVYESNVANNQVAPDADTTSWRMIDGSNVVGIPIGGFMDFGGQTAPNGFVICDGSLQTISGQFQALYDVIGDYWAPGGTSPGNGQFYLPDRRRAVAVGSGAKSGAVLSPALQGTTTGSSGGEETHVLLANELPPHQHPLGFNASNQPVSAGSSALGVGSQNPQETQVNVTTNTPINEFPPSIIVTACIRYA